MDKIMKSKIVWLKKLLTIVLTMVNGLNGDHVTLLVVPHRVLVNATVFIIKLWKYVMVHL